MNRWLWKTSYRTTSLNGKVLLYASMTKTLSNVIYHLLKEWNPMIFHHVKHTFSCIIRSWRCRIAASTWRSISRPQQNQEMCLNCVYLRIFSFQSKLCSILWKSQPWLGMLHHMLYQCIFYLSLKNILIV